MADKYYYNGVLLPEIPADILAEYPYLMLERYNYDHSYTLHAISNKPYKYDGQQVSNTTDWIKIPSGERCSCSCPNGGTEWGAIKTSTSDTNHNQFNFTVVWSNFDIPNGSADSNVIYFPATKAYRSVDVFTPDILAISKERMIGIADQARRLGNVEGELTPEQIQSSLESVVLQEKTVTPTSEQQEIVPDEGYYGISKVTVEAVEDSGGEVTLPENARLYYVGNANSSLDMVNLIFESNAVGALSE